MIETEAIVLSSIKYGDKDLIVRLLTREKGIQSFLLKGFFGSKKKNAAHFFPFRLLQISYLPTPNQSLKFLKSFEAVSYEMDVYENPYKNSQLFFLAEWLNKCIKEEDFSDAKFFEWLKDSLQMLENKKANFADFHLWFIINLSLFIGFYPNVTNHENAEYFDLENGIFCKDFPHSYLLKGDDLTLFKRLLLMEYDMSSLNQFKQQERQLLLDILCTYYGLHVTDFKTPKSLDVLKMLFSDV